MSVLEPYCGTQIEYWGLRLSASLLAATRRGRSRSRNRQIKNWSAARPDWRFDDQIDMAIGVSHDVGSAPYDISQGNESKLTSSRPQDLQQIIGVPRGALAAPLDGSLVVDLAHEIEGEVTDHGHVGRAVTGEQA